MLIIKTEQKDSITIVKAEILNIEYKIGTIEFVDNTHYVAYDYNKKVIYEFNNLNLAKLAIIEKFENEVMI